MIIYIGESSDNISTGEGQLWSLSEDEWIGKWLKFLFAFYLRFFF
jgi:hypothetical protein